MSPIEEFQSYIEHLGYNSHRVCNYGVKDTSEIILYCKDVNDEHDTITINMFEYSNWLYDNRNKQ